MRSEDKLIGSVSGLLVSLEKIPGFTQTMFVEEVRGAMQNYCLERYGVASVSVMEAQRKAREGEQ